MAVNAGDSKVSSCRQSCSPWLIPGVQVLARVVLLDENSVENMLFRFSVAGETGRRDIIVEGVK